MKIFGKENVSLAPYSHAVQSGNYVFLSGQVATDPDTGKVIEGNVKVQTKIIMDHIQSFLEENGLNMNHIVKCTISLTNYDRDFADMNNVYQSYFTPPYPARLAVGVQRLFPGCCVEIDAIVEINSN